jgi:hypothetical protein
MDLGLVSRSFRLQPICSCFSLLFLKMTCSCLACERTAVSVRSIRIPIALELSPVSANLRSLSSSAWVHGREAKCAGSVIARPVWRALRLRAKTSARSSLSPPKYTRQLREDNSDSTPSNNLRTRPTGKRARPSSAACPLACSCRRIVASLTERPILAACRVPRIRVSRSPPSNSLPGKGAPIRSSWSPSEG